MPGTVKRRRELTRRRVLAAALALIDQSGLDACSMHTLAKRLNVTAKALYRHVANKDDLLRSVADLVLSDIVLPDPAEPWPDQLREIGLELKRVLDEHPQVTPLCARRASVFPGVIPIADAAIAAGEHVGIGPQEAIRISHAVTNYTIGFSLAAADYARQEDKHDFADNGGYASTEQYLFGLDLLVNGFTPPADREHA
jgi:TetR/AcrR family transcriptional regulator, tetracycline repressor protein